MSLEEFKSIDCETLPISRLISIIAKNQTAYLNHQLEEVNINVSQLHILFEISHQKEINQDKIATRCNFDKSGVARSIKKLEENNLITREVDNNNRRQNKISLTPQGEKILNQAIKKLNSWEEYIIKDNPIDKKLLQKVLKDIILKSIEFNQKEE
ncbi:MAG: MarR family transcriptional regulator [Methanobrevibacter thaueri]|nr:MarR family transcriptional regulator [Methanobrevibacter thaueri]